MILCCINHPNLVLPYLILLFISSSIASRQNPIQTSFITKLKSVEYKPFAKYCFIQDYPAWLQKQYEFDLWFDLAKLLRLPIDEDVDFQRELKQYRLQYECLRFFERLSISFGPG